MKPLIGFKAAKANFFNVDTVAKAVDKANKGRLSMFGAFVRTRAKTSIKKAGSDREAPKVRNAQGRLVFRKLKSSQPGKPPFSRTGLLKQFIYFSFDPAKRSVVIGPTLINKPSGAPETLEYGGTVDLPSWFKGDDGKPIGRAGIEARPYMQPAFDEEKRGLPKLWKDSVK